MMMMARILFMMISSSASWCGSSWPSAALDKLRAPNIRAQANCHQPYSRADDAYLWKHQNDDVEEMAASLGRGVASCEKRLEKLRNPKSSGYKRLFGDDMEEERPRPSLRPMREVMQRIMYGGDLDGGDFIVGYHDRFRVAPVEAPFDAPNKGIAGSERALIHALPEHRIEYLKYRKRLVWHKTQRLDDIFGSQGGVTIRDVVDGYDAWARDRKQRLQRASVRSVDALGGGAAGKDALASLKTLLASVLHGELASDAFVDEVLSDAYFGADGYGLAASPTGAPEYDDVTDEGSSSDAHEARGMPLQVEPPLIELLRTLPDERADLRAELLQMLAERGLQREAAS